MLIFLLILSYYHKLYFHTSITSVAFHTANHYKCLCINHPATTIQSQYIHLHYHMCY